MDKPIGGYFGWEFPEQTNHFPHEDGCLVNSGHHALQYILMQLGNVKKVYIPYYTCESVLIPIKTLGIPYEFYHIDNRFEIASIINLQEQEYIIYNNYFGIKSAYASSLFHEYGDHLIIDNAQALYAEPVNGCYQFYSPRKFVACPDGGIVVPKGKSCIDMKKSISYDKCQSLLQRADGDISGGHSCFRAVSSQLVQEPLMLMSQLSENILQSKDYDCIKRQRFDNFTYLHSRLSGKNLLTSVIDNSIERSFECPLVYPFYTMDSLMRQKLISEKIFVAQYWPNVLNWCGNDDTEYNLATYIMPLPIDQRYNQNDMDRIIKAISL